MPESEYVESLITADKLSFPEFWRGNTKVTGIVKHSDGVQPVELSSVCMVSRSSSTLVTDERGRFEVRLNSIPTDEHGKRDLVQQLIAFDAYRPLATQVAVSLDKQQDLTLTLQPHESDWLQKSHMEFFTEWARVIPADQATSNAAKSLRGQHPPEFDALLGKDRRAGCETRGPERRYLLLDFWFMGCLPHEDFPSVEPFDDLYKDKGVAVIGVHNNLYQSPQEVRDHVAKIGLPYPVAVDDPDGRMVARYKPYGLPEGYPATFCFAGRNGSLDDRTIPSPPLRGSRWKLFATCCSTEGIQRNPARREFRANVFRGGILGTSRVGRRGKGEN